jgi:hypothetical protein
MDSQLLKGLEMTRQMLELVKDGTWEEVAKLGSERLKLLHQWGDSADPEEVRRNVGVLQEIQALDAEMEVIGQQGRKDIADKLRKLHQGRKAGKAYLG